MVYKVIYLSNTMMDEHSDRMHWWQTDRPVAVHHTASSTQPEVDDDEDDGSAEVAELGDDVGRMPTVKVSPALVGVMMVGSLVVTADTLTLSTTHLCRLSTGPHDVH